MGIMHRLGNSDDSTVKGPSELKLSITISTSKSVLELKEEISAKSDVEKDRQRLIYSGGFSRWRARWMADVWRCSLDAGCWIVNRVQ